MLTATVTEPFCKQDESGGHFPHRFFKVSILIPHIHAVPLISILVLSLFFHLRWDNPRVRNTRLDSNIRFTLYSKLRLYLCICWALNFKTYRTTSSYAKYKHNSPHCVITSITHTLLEPAQLKVHCWGPLRTSINRVYLAQCTRWHVTRCLPHMWLNIQNFTISRLRQCNRFV